MLFWDYPLCCLFVWIPCGRLLKRIDLFFNVSKVESLHIHRSKPLFSFFQFRFFQSVKSLFSRRFTTLKSTLPNLCRYHISISGIFKQFQNSLATDNTRIDRIRQNLSNTVCMIAVHYLRHLRHKLKCFALYCLCIVLFICIVITTIADFLNPVIHTVIHKSIFSNHIVKFALELFIDFIYHVLINTLIHRNKISDACNQNTHIINGLCFSELFKQFIVVLNVENSFRLHLVVSSFPFSHLTHCFLYIFNQ